MTGRKRLRNRWNRELSIFWQQNPITYCEVRFEGCFGTYGLAPAHSKKRREIKTKAEFFEVIAACEFCHKKLDERMSHAEMRTKVLEIIEKRDVTITATT